MFNRKQPRHGRVQIAKPFPRKLHINGQEWSYIIFDSGMLGIRTPDLKLTHYIHATYITPLFRQVFYDYDWSQSTQISNLLRPASIRSYVEDNLVGKTEPVLLKNPSQEAINYVPHPSFEDNLLVHETNPWKVVKI